MIQPEDDEVNFKTQWWFDWPEVSGGKSCYLLRVDEDSSPEELEDEVEYWMTCMRLYELEGVHKRSLMQAIRWMTMLMETNGS